MARRSSHGRFTYGDGDHANPECNEAEVPDDVSALAIVSGSLERLALLLVAAAAHTITRFARVS